jgi:hypothetical protein
MNVRHFLGVVPLIVAAIPVSALARDCNDVKAEIDAKIKAKGVTNYILRIVNGPDVKEGKIVGNCESGAKSIIYLRDATGKSGLTLSSTAPKLPESVSPAPATPVNTEASR